MINLTRLYLNSPQPADGLRYGIGHGRPFATAAERRPVVVWNITRRCNLRCIHCYSDSEPRSYGGELTSIRAGLGVGITMNAPQVAAACDIPNDHGAPLGSRGKWPPVSDPVAQPVGWLGTVQVESGEIDHGW